MGDWVADFSRATVRYRCRLAVDGLTLGVSEGQVYALPGCNGAGKSSLVRCLLGQQRLTTGRALLFGEDAWASRPRAMARVGVVPEESDLPPDLDADALVAWCQRVYPRWDDARVRQRLRRTGVPPRTPVNRLSRGERPAGAHPGAGARPRATEPGRPLPGAGCGGPAGGLGHPHRRAGR